MPTYELKCDKCDKVYERVLSIRSTKEEKEYPCEVCGGPVYQTFTESTGFITKENNDPDSCKPGSYWRNAEAVKQKESKKRVTAHKEKVFYKDPETAKKAENFKRNIKDPFHDGAPDGMVPRG